MLTRVTQYFAAGYELIHPQDMRRIFNKISDQVDKLNPLEGKKSNLRKCSEQCVLTVERWARKNPQDERLCAPYMSWQTYQANLIRKGEIFTGSGNSAFTYSWLESL